MSRDIKPSFEEIKIELEPEQRFFYQRDSDGDIVLVDEIQIFAYAKQITLFGTHFSVDYEDKTILKAADRSFMNFEMNLLGEYSDSEG
ncbi:hypothetical protein J2Z69_000756 [Paenibacillus shirakamiensis]|uniref:Uncharacterized protein n=1 Tax=Paenibacillus shirakamiensis TaxID=1265935 RepID=A0ABS4JDD8_9BACL|nr:hypothetical protein [Paenibacillus shirakamiensis]MBP1999737.1 hypothetical protein [Paenibacillus shirakamiensis]